MKKSKQIKFLSRSILLEEAGLPWMNTWIIIILCLGIVGFLFWANVMTLNETVTGIGPVSSGAGHYEVQLSVPSESIMSLELNQKVNVSVPQYESDLVVKGLVKAIESTVTGDTSTSQSINISVDLIPTTEQISKLERLEKQNVQMNGEIIVGSKSLLTYMLGPVFKLGSSVSP